jgi:RecG-like helicase
VGMFDKGAKAAEAKRVADTSRAMEELGRVALDGCVPIGSVRWRDRVKVAGKVRAMRVQPWAEVASLELTVADSTGGLTVVFLGRRQIPGIRLGSRIVVHGMVGASRGQLAMLNPRYQLLPAEVSLPF